MGHCTALNNHRNQNINLLMKYLNSLGTFCANASVYPRVVSLLSAEAKSVYNAVCIKIETQLHRLNLSKASKTPGDYFICIIHSAQHKTRCHSSATSVHIQNTRLFEILKFRVKHLSQILEAFILLHYQRG